jgi:hypothetical protein
VYEEFVLNKTRDSIYLDMFDHTMLESRFVEYFKPGGYMDSTILDLQCRLWGEERDDRIILSQSAAVSTNSTYFMF